jgi:hypothetical protein
MQAGARIYSSTSYNSAFFSLLVVNVAALGAAMLLRETHCQQLPPVRQGTNRAIG